MKRYRLTALASSLLLIAGTTACTQNPEPAAEHSASEIQTKTGFDSASYRKKIEALKALWTQPGHESEISAEIPELLQTVDAVYADYARAEIAYYQNWNDQTLTAARDQAYEDFSVAIDMTRWAIANGSRRSEYSELFAPYDTSTSEYYMINNLLRIISYAKSEASESSKLLDSYYNTVYGEECASETLNRKCAELYLDILQNVGSSQYDYEAYSRDYTPEDVTAVYEELVTTFLPLYQALGSTLSDSERTLPAYTDPMQAIEQYAPRLSAEIAESSDKLFREKLYTIASGTDCYDGSYTVSLPNEQTALMYLYFDNSFLDFSAAVHEFGHFHCERREQTPVLMQDNCIDISESQSQGMEALFMQFYGDIFGSDAETAELCEVYNLMDAVMSGFAVGRFEAAVMEQADSLTPEEVIELYDQYCTACGIGLELYEITHLYEQPGYYISYGVSALAAIQLYTMMLSSKVTAMQHYGQISAVSGASGEMRFREAMHSCGMQDIFRTGTVAAITDQLQKRIGELT